MVVNERGCGIGYGSETAGPGWGLAVESEMWGAIDESCKAVDRGNVFAGTHVVNVGHKAVGGEVDNIIDAGAWVTDMGCKAIEGDIVIASAQILDIGLKPIDGDKVLAGSDAVDEVCNAIGGGDVFVDARDVDMGCKDRIGCGSGVVDSWWRLGIGLET